MESDMYWEELRDKLLYCCRNGDIKAVQELLTTSREGKISLDINCKGQSKSNMGWTPLHLATYFGHKDVVELLLDNGANINSVNDAGDTALHKASFIDREVAVIMIFV